MNGSPHVTTTAPWRSRFARLHPKAYLVLHALVGGIATLVLTWLFLAIADEIPERSTLARTDLVVHRWIEAHGTEWGEKVFFLVSYLGAPVLVAIVVATLLWFAWRRDWSRAAILAATTGGGVVLGNVLKLVFHRGRPETATEFITRATWSFPSGHAMNSMIGYGFLAVLLLDHVTERRRRIGLVSAAVLLIGTIGFSRVYLGVHYMSDVAGGWIAGAAWLIACVTGYHYAVERRGGAASAPVKLSRS